MSSFFIPFTLHFLAFIFSFFFIIFEIGSKIFEFEFIIERMYKLFSEILDFIEIFLSKAHPYLNSIVELQGSIISRWNEPYPIDFLTFPICFSQKVEN